jgi:hypothetical protein
MQLSDYYRAIRDANSYYLIASGFPSRFPSLIASRFPSSSGDPLVWTLESGPAGMVLDPATNALIWTPTAAQANTTPSIIVE